MNENEPRGALDYLGYVLILSLGCVMLLAVSKLSALTLNAKIFYGQF